jgi:hypothetical protein
MLGWLVTNFHVFLDFAFCIFLPPLLWGGHNIFLFLVIFGALDTLAKGLQLLLDNINNIALLWDSAFS